MNKKKIIGAFIFALIFGMASPALSVSAASSTNNENIETRESVSIPSSNYNGITVYGTNGQEYNALSSSVEEANDLNQVIRPSYLRSSTFVVKVFTTPYCSVYSYNSKGKLVKTNKGLATGTKWAANIWVYQKWWQVATNEFVSYSEVVQVF